MRNGDLERLVHSAREGDRTAWDALVRTLSVIACNAARAYRLGDADVLDVCQDTWLALASRPAALRKPACLPGWLATAARRYAGRRAAGRRRPVADPDGGPLTAPSAESLFLLTERDQELWKAVSGLSERGRRLVWLLAHRPELTQLEIAAELGISPGTVGPLRRRCLNRLRHLLDAESDN